ncbi:hypothetical protein ANCCAN_18770 [Ancylostoma caninum]|uniref:Zinc finger, C2H2 type n=1 Tax=Ancylostoma caninum TaxID=29170 RepID=A0A368FYI4_ANCCA|nr:hypothetical protein ANCCAN_18770 [Ancylostoma caninum]
MDPFQWQQYPQPVASSSVSGTSELFSSTYAMLSDTASAPYPDQWHENKSDCESTFYFDAVPGPYGHPSNNMYYPVHDQRFQSPFTETYPRVPQQQYEHHVQVPVSESIQITANYPMHFPHHQHSQKIDYPQSAALSLPPSMAQPPPQTALPTAPVPRPSTVSPCEQTALSSPTLTSNSGSAASETPPISGEVISTDLEGPDNERVMCMACRGVYPSRRSLTGHIGRNEKCREIIGRNYLDQVAMGANPIAPGTENAIKAGALTNGQDGLSPICPHCDRFISHYKVSLGFYVHSFFSFFFAERKEFLNMKPLRVTFADTLTNVAKTRVLKKDHDQTRTEEGTEKSVDKMRLCCHMCSMKDLIQVITQPELGGLRLVWTITILASGGHNGPLVASPVMSPSMGSYQSIHEQDFADNSMYMNGHTLDQQIQLPSDPSPPGAPRKEADPPEVSIIYLAL